MHNDHSQKYDPELQELLDTLQTPEARARAEAPMRDRLRKAAREHEEFLRRSREVGRHRVFR